MRKNANEVPGNQTSITGKKIESAGMGLYIHIPFCASKCTYCDFLSFGNTNEDLQKRYVQALLAEMRAACIEAKIGEWPRRVHKRTQTTRFIIAADAFMDAQKPLPKIDTVYIGGGTPTALPSFLLCEILHELQYFNLCEDAEITVEMNPCTNADTLLPYLVAHRVNRLSVGLQAWQGDLLAKLNRAHTAKDFTKTIHAARAAGINNINVDLMFGLPGQTQDHWHESIAQAISHAPEHISAYSLTPAENTPLWDALEAGDVNLPDEAADRAMYHEAIRLLTAAGYEHYEISNFAKPGRESRHNINCWRRKPYIGFGLGAHSFDGEARWNNTSDMTEYLKSAINSHERTRLNYELLSTQDAMAEAMFLGLRMTKGISPQDFQEKFRKNIAECYGSTLESLVSKGLLVYTTDNIALTPLGLDLANQVFGAFL